MNREVTAVGEVPLSLTDVDFINGKWKVENGKLI